MNAAGVVRIMLAMMVSIGKISEVEAYAAYAKAHGSLNGIVLDDMSLNDSIELMK